MTPRSTILSCAPFVLAGLLCPPAAADDLRSALSQPLAEVSHDVQVSVSHGIARYRVRRTFENAGTRADEASLAIDLPKGAAVTGLRIRARQRWYDAELMEAKAAAARYRELTGRGAWAPKDPALMQWVWPDRVHLQVFPVLPGSASTVEYTLTVPVQYRDGRYILSYPRFLGATEDDATKTDVDANAVRQPGLPLAEPIVHVVPGHGDAMTYVRVDGKRVPPHTPVVLGIPPKQPWIGDGVPRSDASYIWSRLQIVEPGPADTATVTLAIDHTYRNDLSVHLVTPLGRHVPIDVPGGSENDIRGSFDVRLPPGTQANGTWHLMVSDQTGLDVGTLDAWSLTLANKGASGKPKPYAKVNATGLPMFIPDAPQGEGDVGLAKIEIAAPPIRTAQARLGRVVVDKQTAFTRLEIDAAPQMGQIPKRPSVVFVLDASRSVEDIEPQLQVARAYLTHVPDAQVEVVVFRRVASRLTGSFFPASAFDNTVHQAAEAGTLDLGNGSALERGLEMAVSALRGRAGERRIVLLSDTRVRSRFLVQDAIRALSRAPARTIAHVVVPKHGSFAQLKRDDKHALARIPSTTGGVLFDFQSPHGGTKKERAAALLGLVRPISLDHVRIAGLDLSNVSDMPDVLREGASYRLMMKSGRAPKTATIRGRVWNKPFRRVVRATERFSRATAAFVFSEDEHDSLTPAQMMKVATYGRAVSPVTSYLAVEPGVRPSTAGLHDNELGTASGIGGIGMSGYGAGGGGGVYQKSWTIDELIRPGLDACAARHAPEENWKIALDIETTSREIVDVRLVSGAAKAFDACVVEAAWNVALSWNFTDRRRMWRIALN